MTIIIVLSTAVRHSLRDGHNEERTIAASCTAVLHSSDDVPRKDSTCLQKILGHLALLSSVAQATGIMRAYHHSGGCVGVPQGVRIYCRCAML
jgi:hypothetical protein